MEIKISEEDKALLKQMASEILCDKNRFLHRKRLGWFKLRQQVIN